MKILIAIHASHSRPEQMQAVRETWLMDTEQIDAGIVLNAKFFLGMEHLTLEELPAHGKEAFGIEEGDTVTLYMPDGPNFDKQRGCGHRTPVCQRKTEGLVKYAWDHNYDFVFKCDDDTFVNVPRLLTSGFEEHDYSGFTTPHYAPDFGFYRFAEGGSGYWLSRAAMDCVLKHGLNLVPVEDYAVGQLLARHDFYVHHDERYCPTLVPCDSDWITQHQAKPDDMRRIYSDLMLRATKLTDLTRLVVTDHLEA